MTNQDIARIFYHIADILEIQNADPFRVRAYREAATVIEGLIKEVAETYKEAGLKGLMDIPSVGKELAFKIEELVRRNKLDFYTALKKEIPAGLLEIMGLEGV
ncbi:MAG: hypothetical protein AAB912_01710, partial [Patescibacteria group bacterium]